MQYILKHPTDGEYQINLTVSLEKFKELLASGKDFLTLFYTEGRYAGVYDPSYLNECETIEVGDPNKAK